MLIPQDNRYITYDVLSKIHEKSLKDLIKNNPEYTYKLIMSMNDQLCKYAGDKTCHKYMKCPCYKSVPSNLFGETCLVAGECPREPWENILYKISNGTLGLPDKQLVEALKKYEEED